MMKSTVVIFGFFLITEIQQTWGTVNQQDAALQSNGLENLQGISDRFKIAAAGGGAQNGGTQKSPATQTSQPLRAARNSMEPAGPQTGKQNFREEADKIREKAAKDREMALNKAQSGYNKFKDAFHRMTAEIDKEREEEIKTAEQEHRKADIIAAAIWRNALQQGTNAQKEVENKYQEIVSAINEKLAEVQKTRDATLQSADEQFVKMYTQLEENRKKGESLNKDGLAQVETECKNAVKSIQKLKAQAEKEFRIAANNYNTIPLDQWAKMATKYETDMETYKQALEEVDGEWLDVLNQIGIGKQYEETLNKAVMELVNAHRKAASDATTAIEQYNETLKGLQQRKNDITAEIDAVKQKAEKELKEAREKAKNEAQKKYEAIDKNSKIKRGLALLHMKKFEAELRKTQDEESKKFDKAMKEASAVESGIVQPTSSVETTPGNVAQSQKKVN